MRSIPMHWQQRWRTCAQILKKHVGLAKPRAKRVKHTFPRVTWWMQRFGFKNTWWVSVGNLNCIVPQHPNRLGKKSFDCHSERSEESLLNQDKRQREILRAQSALRMTFCL